MSLSRFNEHYNPSNNLYIPDDVKTFIHHTVADKTELAAIPLGALKYGLKVRCLDDGAEYVWTEGLAGTEADEQELLCVAHDTITADSWKRAPGGCVLRVAIGFADTDGEVLVTVPEGMAFNLAGLPFYEITTAWTGGSSSAIGLSTNISGYTTQGDIIGGATGDVEAGLTVGVREGTIGGELGDQTGMHAVFFLEDSELQFDRITSAFTAGAGFVHIPINLQWVA